MKLDNFKELLIKKTADKSMANLVKFIREDVLIDMVLESLEKMADSNNKGSSPNHAVLHYGTEMDPQHDPNLIHDALSHHVSHYKSAIDNGNQKIANQHARKIFDIVDMSRRLEDHSNGKLKVSAVPVQPWERHTKSDTFGQKMDRLKSAKNAGQQLSPKDEEWLSDNPVTRGKKNSDQFINDTKGWGYTDSDFSFLQKAPHSDKTSLNEVRKTGHAGAYPLEHIAVNGKYVDVEPIEQQDTFKSHPFDSHPIMSHYSVSPKNRTPEKDAEYRKQYEDFQSSPELDGFFSSQEARESKDPQAFSQRGSSKSQPVHKQVDPVDMSSLPAQTKDSATQPVLARKVPKQAAPNSGGTLSREARQAILDKLSPQSAEEFKRLFPDEE